MKLYNTLAVNAADRQIPKQIAVGVFQGLHRGHQKVIRAAAAAKQAGQAACVLTFDFSNTSPPGKTNSRALLTDTLFAQILEQMGIDMIFRVPFEELRDRTPQEFVTLLGQIGAKGVFCGANFHFGKGAAGTPDMLAELGEAAGLAVGVQELFCLEGETVSSTRIRRLVQAGEMPQAAALLGRPFSIDFVVEHGRALGRAMGVPTINQPFPPQFATPRYGVYASLVHLPDGLHSGVSNIGVKPTVGSENVLAETFIHAFSGDLYGQRVRVELLEFVRPEQKFGSIGELQEQIWRDSACAAEIVRRYCESAEN